MDDGAAGRQVVGRRARRAGDDDAVGFHPGHELAVHGDFQIDHPRDLTARDDDVVEHQMRVAHVPITQRRRLQQTPFVHLRGSGDDRVERLVQLVERDLGEKAQAAEVHAQDGNGAARAADAGGHAQQRPVAAQYQQQVHVRGQRVARQHRRITQPRHLRRRRLENALNPPRLEPLQDARQVRRGRAEALLGDDADALDGHRPLRRCSRNSWLPVAPVTGDGVSAMGVNPTARAASRTSSSTRACTAGSVTSPPRSTSSRPASN